MAVLLLATTSRVSQPGVGKQPYAIARRDGSLLAFAGLWEWWKAPDGELVRTAAILTTSANATMRQLRVRPDWGQSPPEPGGNVMALSRYRSSADAAGTIVAATTLPSGTPTTVYLTVEAARAYAGTLHHLRAVAALGNFRYL